MVFGCLNQVNFIRPILDELKQYCPKSNLSLNCFLQNEITIGLMYEKFFILLVKNHENAALLDSFVYREVHIVIICPAALVAHGQVWEKLLTHFQFSPGRRLPPLVPPDADGFTKSEKPLKWHGGWFILRSTPPRDEIIVISLILVANYCLN